MGTGGSAVRSRAPRRPSAAGLALVVAVTLALLAAPIENATAAVAPGATIRHRALTTKGPTSLFTGALPAIRVTAGARTKTSDRREVFYAATAPDATDSRSCATWASETEGVEPTIQQGAAFRVAKKAGGGYRAITVTKNVHPAGKARWVFNFHVWDTSNKAAPYTQIGAVDLGRLLAPGGTPLTPLPWNFCARLVGSTLAFIVWLPNQVQPAWGDPTHGGSVTIPAGWTQPGKTGWFVGHLHMRETALLTNLMTVTTR